MTALAFVALYLEYLSRAGTWFADLPLVLAALPFTLVMRALNGGSYDFSGDMTGRVVAAAAFCCGARLWRGVGRRDGRALMLAAARRLSGPASLTPRERAEEGERP